MTENLRLNFTTTTTLTPADTDIVSNWTPGVATETASSHTKWNPTETYSPEMFHQVRSYSNGNNTLTTYDGETQKIGTFYNWYTATATSGTYNNQNEQSPLNPSAYYSICPKGWAIPYLGGRIGWMNLLTTSYGYSAGGTDTRQIVSSFPFSLIISGLYDADYGASTTQNSFGYYHSGDAATNSSIYYLLISNISTTGIKANSFYYATMPKSDGFPIRCVSR